MRILKTGLAVFAVAALGLASTTTAYANCSGKACVGPIKQLYLHENGNLYIDTSGDESKLTDCTPMEGFVLVPRTHPLFDSWLSMLLAAQLSGREATVRVKNGTGACTLAYVMLR